MDGAAELAQPGKENEKLRTDNVDPGRQLGQLGVDCTDLKRQLFGSNSEKRVEIPPEQTAFRDRPGPEEPEFEFPFRMDRGNGTVPDLSATSRTRCSRRATGPTPPTRNSGTTRSRTLPVGPTPAAEELELIGALQFCEREIRKRKLEAWLSDPEVPIDTNHLERGLRVLPLGRKNWLFRWTEVGAEAVGIVQSPVATCRRQGVDPRACLEDVLRRVSVHPSLRVEEPAPRLWKDPFAGDPMKSDLGTGVERLASDPPGAG